MHELSIALSIIEGATEEARRHGLELHAEPSTAAARRHLGLVRAPLVFITIREIRLDGRVRRRCGRPRRSGRSTP